jgi:hypothetical protein
MPKNLVSVVLNSKPGRESCQLRQTLSDKQLLKHHVAPYKNCSCYFNLQLSFCRFSIYILKTRVSCQRTTASQIRTDAGSPVRALRVPQPSRPRRATWCPHLALTYRRLGTSAHTGPGQVTRGSLRPGHAPRVTPRGRARGLATWRRRGRPPRLGYVSPKPLTVPHSSDCRLDVGHLVCLRKTGTAGHLNGRRCLASPPLETTTFHPS